MIVADESVSLPAMVVPTSASGREVATGTFGSLTGAAGSTPGGFAGSHAEQKMFRVATRFASLSGIAVGAGGGLRGALCAAGRGLASPSRYLASMTWLTPLARSTAHTTITRR